MAGRNNGTGSLRGYHEVFEEWGVRDASDMVLRDRNHPSIILWSIGNEIDYPDDPFTHPRGRGFDPSVPRQPTEKKTGLSADLMPAIARRLIAAVKQFDGTRPVTMALADINASNATGVVNLLDVVGYNYLEQFYDRDHKAYPARVIYGSENSRSLDAWRSAATNAFVAGQFLWTGMDFLGEAGRFPNHGSGAGLLDVQGFWKRDAYLRQALWGDEPMVYAAAWRPGAGESRMTNWQRSLGRVPAAQRWGFADDARKSIPVEIYSNCDSVEALLNGRSLGEKTISDRLAPALIWAIPNEPGKVEFIGKKGGARVARFELESNVAEFFIGAERGPGAGVAGVLPGIAFPRVVPDFAGVRDGAEGPDALAGADVIPADVAGDILFRRRRRTRLQGRAHHDHALDHDGRRTGADHAGFHGGPVQAVEEIDEAVFAEGCDGLSGFGIEGDQLVAG